LVTPGATGGAGSRRAVLGRGLALGAAGVTGAACAGHTATDLGEGTAPRPAIIEILHQFGPTSADSRWTGTLLERVRHLAPHLTVRSTVTAGSTWEPLQKSPRHGLWLVRCAPHATVFHV
jgi:hypothetical protein